MTTADPFDTEVRKLAQQFAQLIYDEALRRAGAPGNVGEIGAAIVEIGTEVHTRFPQLVGSLAIDLLRDAHNDAVIRDFRKELGI